MNKVQTAVTVALAVIRQLKLNTGNAIDDDSRKAIAQALRLLGGYATVADLRVDTGSPAWFAYQVLVEVRFAESPTHRISSLRFLEKQIVACAEHAVGN